MSKKKMVEKTVDVGDSRLSFIKLLEYKISSYPDNPTAPETMSRSKAWANLCQLLKTKDERVVEAVYQALINNYPHMPEKQAAWEEIINSFDNHVEGYSYYKFIDVLAGLYPTVPDKIKAWDGFFSIIKRDLPRSSCDDYSYEKVHGNEEMHFSILADRVKAWKAWPNLCKLLKTDDAPVVDAAYQALINNYPHMPDKQAAWEEIINSFDGHIEEHDYHRFVNVLAGLYPAVPDKSKAWADLCQLLKNKNEHMVEEAYQALINNYPRMPDKQAAWEEIINLFDARIELQAWAKLCQLLKAKDEHVVDQAYQALINNYPHMQDKQAAWEEIINSFEHVEGHSYHRFVNVLAGLYPTVPDKVKAWDGFFSIIKRDLPRSNWDDFSYQEIHDTIELFFSIIPDKGKAWDDLFNLTQGINGGRGWRNLLELLEDLLPKTADVQKAWTDLLYYIPKVYSTAGFHYREQTRIDSTVTRTFRFVSDFLTAWNDVYTLSKHEYFGHIAYEIIRGALSDAYYGHEKYWVPEKKLEAIKALFMVAQSKNDPDFFDFVFENISPIAERMGYHPNRLVC